MKLKEKIVVLMYWIGDNRKKIKFWSAILLIATLSFGLGYIVNREFNYAPIIIEKCASIANN